MKRLFLLAIISFALVLITNAQKNNNVEQTIMKIEQEILDGVLKKDGSAGDKHLAASAVFTGPDGMMMTKSEFLSVLKSGDLNLESSTIEDMKVQVHGNTAIATYRTTDKGKWKDTDISGQYRWTDVFVKEKGNWLLVAGHGSKLAPQQ